MKQDKLLPLAAKMTDLLKADQDRKFAKGKRFLIRAKELEDRLNEFQIENDSIMHKK